MIDFILFFLASFIIFIMIFFGIHYISRYMKKMPETFVKTEIILTEDMIFNK